MKTLSRILLISVSLYACGNASESKFGEGDSTARSANNGAQADPGATNPAGTINLDPEMENKKKLTDAIITSKQAINELRSDVSDSLTKTGLSPQKRTLFSKTIQQLEESSDLLNKQLETILVADLQNSRNKLNGIVKKMKESQQELTTMIAKIDKITGYLQIASTLVESLSPVKTVTATPAKPASGKK